MAKNRLQTSKTSKTGILRITIIGMIIQGIFLIACDRESTDKEKSSSLRLFLQTSPELSGFLYIEEYKVGGFTKIDSIKSTGKNEYQKQYNLSYPTVFAISDQSGDRLIFPVISGDSLLIVLSDDKLFDSILSGNKTIRSFNLLTQKTHQFLDTAEYYSAMVRDSLGSPFYPELRLKANRGYQANLEDLRTFYRGFVLENDTSILSLLALQNQIGPGFYVLDPMEDPGIYLRIDSILSKRYPVSAPVLAFNTRVDNILKQLLQKSGPEALNEK